MTYCLGLKIDAGIIMMSDTRTNAGLDNISRFRKMFTWEVPGERVLVACTAGDLSITQGMLSRLNADIARAREDDSIETILNAKTLFRTAELFGDAIKAEHSRHCEALGPAADASVLLAGQRKNGEMRLYLIYSAGNFIEATEDTPFLQIGEHKYGKPILDRVIYPATPIDRAMKAVFLSMDSTLRSNFSVGMPLDLAVIRADEINFAVQRRIDVEDSDFAAISKGWADEISDAFESLPPVEGFE